MNIEIKKNIERLIKELELEKIPDEGCYVKKTFLSSKKYSENQQLGSHMYGLYSPYVDSQSCFHKLSCDELWHFYGGDPIILHLIYPDGQYKFVKLNSNVSNKEAPFFVIPAGVWQAGKTIDGGDYSLFGCTVIPSFNEGSFKIESRDKLLEKFPKLESIIMEFGFQNENI